MLYTSVFHQCLGDKLLESVFFLIMRILRDFLPSEKALKPEESNPKKRKLLVKEALFT